MNPLNNTTMLFIILPPIDLDNTNTQIEHEVIYEEISTSTCLSKTYRIFPTEFNLSKWKKGEVFSANLSLDYIDETNNSTWEERNQSEFDLVSNITFGRSIKVKSRIKAVTKYKPHIVLD